MLLPEAALKRSSAQEPDMPSLEASASQIIETEEKRSEELALLLVVLFGPFGLPYTSARGGAVMIALALFGAILTMGLAPLALWPVCILWVVIAGAMHRY